MSIKRVVVLITLCMVPALSHGKVNLQGKEDIKVFFNYAQEYLPKLEVEIAKAEEAGVVEQEKLEQFKRDAKLFKVIDLIAKADIKGLKKATRQQLQFDGGQIWVEGTRFKDTLGGRLDSRILAGHNALVFVVLHSMFDTTPQDKEKTLSMFKLLLDKKLDVKSELLDCFWIKATPTDSYARDYIASYTLSELAEICDFPEAQALIKRVTN